MPFLRQGDYPAAPEGELDSYVAGIGRMYRRLYAYADARRNPGEAIVPWDTSTLPEPSCRTTTGASAPSWEVWSPYPQIPSTRDRLYGAGHIHKAQRIGGREAVRYAGSPLPMSFSEKNYRHQVIAVEIEEGKVMEIEAIGILESWT